jgi:diguanylate cyclase (GGDEF)-like protein
MYLKTVLTRHYDSSDFDLTHKVRKMFIVLTFGMISLFGLSAVSLLHGDLTVAIIQCGLGILLLLLSVPLYKGAYSFASSIFFLVLSLSFLALTINYEHVNPELFYKYGWYVLLAEIFIIIFTKSNSVIIFFGINALLSLSGIYLFHFRMGKLETSISTLLIFMEVFLNIIVVTWVSFVTVRFSLRLLGRLKEENDLNKLKTQELEQANFKLMHLKESLELQVEERTRELSNSLKIQYELNNAVMKSAEDLEKSNRELHLFATTDAMTGIFNRRTGEEILAKKIQLMERKKFPLSLGFIDVNNLKLVNDSQGHIAGDDLIKTVAAVLHQICRESDSVCRLGGDEFLLILPDCNLENAEVIGKRIEEQIRKINETKSKPFEVSVSEGFVEYDFSLNPDLESFIKQADEKMYEDKVKKKMQRKS